MSLSRHMQKDARPKFRAPYVVQKRNGEGRHDGKKKKAKPHIDHRSIIQRSVTLGEAGKENHSREIISSLREGVETRAK